MLLDPLMFDECSVDVSLVADTAMPALVPVHPISLTLLSHLSFTFPCHFLANSKYTYGGYTLTMCAATHSGCRIHAHICTHIRTGGVKG